MEDALSNGILVGRPFGGVSICWSPDLDHVISPLSNFRHKRVVGIELKTAKKHVLLLNVYMPYYNSSRRAECMAETLDAISMLETIIEQHQDHSIIIGGDINSELKGESPFDCYWTEFMSTHQLTCCDRFYPSNSITYHHKNLGHKKWNDHFIVSKELVLSDFLILDEGDNLSDHFPIVMKMSTKVQTDIQNSFTSPIAAPSLRWEKLTTVQKQQYESVLHDLIENLPLPEVPTQCALICKCDDPLCRYSLQREYDALINCLKKADDSLPRQKKGVEKEWWTKDLTDLKDKSIEIHTLWINQGRPRQGWTHDERVRVRAVYKHAIRVAQRSPKQEVWDRLHGALTESDTTSFWNSWRHIYNKNKNNVPTVVNGISSKSDIANAFMHHFRENSTPNNIDNVKKLDDKFADAYKLYKARHIENCDCKHNNISVVNVIDALLCMRRGKSADADNISAEHLHNAPLNFIQRMTALFNLMLSHSFVPEQFRLGFMIPLIKDHRGNHSDMNNYRGITISPILSKVFEHVLKAVFSEHLQTSKYQFGFKRSSSTSHALHCLRETVDYYVNHGSRVYCTFLDASKAFDRLVHSGLFLKMMERNIPFVFLNIIISWYNGLQCQVKWDNHFSEWFSVTAGVRQGGVLSPDFYSIYVDDLISKLEKMNKGCYFHGVFAAAFFYADDMAILSPSLKGLSSLLHLCEQYCAEWDICLNAKKSRCLYFGKRTNISYNLILHGKKIEWAEEWSYLGVTLKSGKTFNCSVRERIKKFYRCVNAILRIDGYSNDMVMLRLIETHCIPILTYAIEIIHVSDRDEHRQLRVAYNSVFRKIFNYRWSESVSALQKFLERPTWEQLVDKRRSTFTTRVLKTDSSSLASCLLK